MNRISLSLFLTLAMMLTACTSYYSSAIVGHDSVLLPPPSAEGKETRAEGGLFVKTCPTGSKFTSDSTQSLQAGLMTALTVPLGEYVDFQGGGVISGYGSLTYTEDPLEDGEEALFPSWGMTGQGLVRFFMGRETIQFSLGAEGTLNREWGEYGEYRKELAASSENYVNLSPSGYSFAGQIRAGIMDNWYGPHQILVEAGAGVALTDLFPEEEQSPKPLYSLSLTYRNDKLWCWLAWESLSFLNTGVSGGLGFFFPG